MLYEGRAFRKIEKEIKNKIENGEEQIDLKELKQLMFDISYKELQTRNNPEEVARTVTDFVNSSFGDEDDKFVETMLSEHRTLQQSAFRLMNKCISGWAKMAKTDWYDARNEATVKMAEKMEEAVKEEGLPLI